ncbi:MAG: hypothetical protein ACJAT2_001188 [Bacteriovoracaceae bacterium]|jgi:hypothetical protein
MKKLFLTSILLISTGASALEIQPLTEAFILQKKENKLYLKVLNGKAKNKLVWVDYSLDNPTGKIFGPNPIDALARPTTNINEALYIQFPFKVEATEDSASFSGQHKARLKKYLFTSLERYVPISNQDVPDIAEDYALACPERPKRKNGEYCHEARAFKLSEKLKSIIREEANSVSEKPELVASIIQHESLFDVFSENLHEKNKCLKDEKNCSPYRWGVGLAQLGATDAALYGLDWNLKVKKPKACKKSKITNDECLTKLIKTCSKYNAHKLKPINCPRAAIRATALKIKAMIPDNVPAWVKEDGKVKLVNLSNELQKNEVEKMRNQIGFYNRSIKVVNSFVEYYDTHGSFPLTYGAAWAMVRSPKSPSISMGYQMLTKEYINRCYVWELAGLCGDLPAHGLISQYQKQLK